MYTRRTLSLSALYLIIYIGATAQVSTIPPYADTVSTAPATALHQAAPPDSIDREASVREVTVTSASALRRMGGAVNGVSIGRQELFKAACCNLGESFTTNPSVDVSYSDAATGAKQIRLLGLNGTYVQMLTEQLPAFRGAARPYSLDYVPGPWMQSIQVSKGASTVKNGYESITGQIDIEYLKPNDTEHLDANVYADSKSRIEANFSGNIHLSEQLSTVVLGHAEKSFAHHDDNDDGFLDMPRREQYHLGNRWKLVTDHYLMHAGLAALKDKREGGQTDHTMAPIYGITTEAQRYEAYMKHAFILDAEHQTNIALMANGALHLQDATYGLRDYSNNEKALDAQLMLETNLTPEHQLSLGTSLSHYYSKQHIGEQTAMSWSNPMPLAYQPYYELYLNQHETTTGAYAQYTLTLPRFTAMAGLRADYSDAWHWFLTPRLHLKYTPTDILTLRASAGRGYRTPRFWAENHFLMASSREIVLDEEPRQEKAWNMGASMAWNIPVANHTLKLNAEYYYTTFQDQMVVSYTNDRPLQLAGGTDLWAVTPAPAIFVHNLHGRSYSHTVQVDATYPLTEGLTVTASWRWNDVRCTYYNGETYRYERLQRPLTSRYKGLLSLSYAPGLQLWHFDATLQLNGGGRIVDHERFHAYEQLQAQITRDFRHLAVYVGGENLTNRRQHNPVRGYADPWGQDFDATLVWGPVHGPLFYVGLRYNLERL